MQEHLESAKIVIALRAARAAAGWSQQEFAERTGISKSKVARMEMMEAELSVSLLTKILRIYNDVGISIDLFMADDLAIKIHPAAFETFQSSLLDNSQRRSDRGSQKNK